MADHFPSLQGNHLVPPTLAGTRMLSTDSTHNSHARAVPHRKQTPPNKTFRVPSAIPPASIDEISQRCRHRPSLLANQGRIVLSCPRDVGGPRRPRPDWLEGCIAPLISLIQMVHKKGLLFCWQCRADPDMKGPIDIKDILCVQATFQTENMMGQFEDFLGIYLIYRPCRPVG